MFRFAHKYVVLATKFSKASEKYQLVQVKRMHSLLKNQAYINGKWTSAGDNKSFKVTNPANQEVVGEVPDMNVSDVQQAIDSAYDTFHSDSWQNITAKERSNLLKNWFRLLEANKEEIAKIMTAESGKPISESLAEVAYGNSFIEWFGEEARRIYGEIVPSPVSSKQILHTKEPIGVAALITPWNFPHAMITRKAGAAIAAGCTVVIKPAEDTPLTALALCKLADDAGFPAGVINVVTSSRPSSAKIGELLCASNKIAGISFTGSTAVGKLLYRQCADGIKRIGLELGGNAPFIVFKSADIDKAIVSAIASKFRNCGQACVSSNRFLIQDEIFDSFIEKFIAAVKTLKIGNGAETDIKLGPLINEAQFNKVTSFVEDAREKGGKVVYGGFPIPEQGSLFYSPTIVTDLKPNMRLYSEEVFGPVVSAIRFKTEDEAIKIANGTQSGLAGYFFSQDFNQVFRVSKRLKMGMVGVNEGIISTAEAAFGGVKESGIGREGSKHGIDEYVDIKYICIGNLN